MADIRRRLVFRHFRGEATKHVHHLVKGSVRHSGVGQSFWYLPLSSALSEVPADDRELPLLFHANTSELQDVAVQATVTFRFFDPVLAATRLDFTVNPDTGVLSTAGIDQVAQIITSLAQGHGSAVVGTLALTEAITAGPRTLSEAISDGLRSEARLPDTGIEVLSVRVLSVTPDKDLQRALQIPARESVQEEADRATYQRRALAVDRERAISENELANRIELANRTEQLVRQQGANTRREAEERAAAEAIESQAEADRVGIRAAAEANRIRVTGEASAEQDRARIDALRSAGTDVTWALTLEKLWPHLPDIDSLTITPDLLTETLGTLIGGRGAGLDQGR